MCLLATKQCPDKATGAVHVKFFWRKGYGRINGGTRVLEVAADIREATPRKGARSTLASAHEVEQTHPGDGARHRTPLKRGA
jgi:hypothetical protein